MIPFIPTIGQTVKVSEFLLEITCIERDLIIGYVKVSPLPNTGRILVQVPYQSVEPFDAVKEAMQNDFNESN